jgi:hypothetical protein
MVIGKAYSNLASLVRHTIVPSQGDIQTSREVTSAQVILGQMPQTCSMVTGDARI